MLTLAILAAAAPLATGQFTSSTPDEDVAAVNRTRVEAAYVLSAASAVASDRVVISGEDSISPAMPELFPEPGVVVVPAVEVLGDPSHWRIGIPSVGVVAPMITLGIDGAGVMQVPHDGSTVGWYRFSAVPGSPGNVVVAAHVDYRGQSAVFSELKSLTAGDLVILYAAGNTLTYEVDSVKLVRPETADVGQIVGTREGPSTVTLITCGGSWDRERGGYDRRVIVTGSLVGAETAS